MAAPIFPPAHLQMMPAPDWGFTENTEAKVSKTSLGDGYEVRRPEGLNHRKRSFQVSWTSLDEPIANQAYDYLAPFVDLVAVQFTHPRRGTVIKCVPSGLSITYDTWNNAVLSVTLTEDFNPV